MRADVLRADILRPPGALVDGFRRACTGCGDCAEACPQAIIQSDGQGAVLLDMTERGCNFCGECARACPTDALSPDRIAAWPWAIAVSDTCLSLGGVACRSCEDACDERAIRFRLELGGRARPLIDESACTGCGACISTCPADAMSLARKSLVELEDAR
ncbi:ferredoxin-type protein NapF [Aliiruegeria haliotis]|uniref:ferredoxin-type protein NapF n=1 Tax=Aliiruegeria haliotis TaxID=1280846 RepID=UPI001FE47CC3|nr:ferredoxin-type protein NapF [Aliiruegeria haliotis]